MDVNIQTPTVFTPSSQPSPSGRRC